MAAARFRSAISSIDLISRASSMVCWPSANGEAGLLQLEQHRRLDDVDADGHLGDAGIAQQRGDLAGMPLHQAEGRVDRAAQAEQAGLAVLRLQPGRIEPVVHGGRAEVPQDRIGAALGQQRPAADLVALPLADLGGGEVADVVDVHHQAARRGRISPAPAASAPAGSGAGGDSRPAPRNRRPWCPAPAARGPSCSAGRCPPRGSGAWARARIWPWSSSRSRIGELGAVSCRRRQLARAIEGP